MIEKLHEINYSNTLDKFKVLEELVIFNFVYIYCNRLSEILIFSLVLIFLCSLIIFCVS